MQGGKRRGGAQGSGRRASRGAGRQGTAQRTSVWGRGASAAHVRLGAAGGHWGAERSRGAGEGRPRWARASSSDPPPPQTHINTRHHHWHRPSRSHPPGFTLAGYVALTGDLPGALAAFKANHPVLAVPVKLLITWPLVYHYLGGARHLVWDLHRIGNNADKSSLLEKDRVEQSSKALLAASAALASVIALL